MTRAERRAWRSIVFGHRGLTLAQKLALLALETYADYPEGTNARPGAARLAQDCRLSVRVVEGALAIGQQLRLIKQTARANPKRGHAACYRLISTCTGVQVEDDVSTCTGVQVDDDFQPAWDDVSTCTDRISTCTPVQPTNPEHQSITPNQVLALGTRPHVDDGAEPDEPVRAEVLRDPGNDAARQTESENRSEPGEPPGPGDVAALERGQERGRSDPVAVSASRLVSDIVPRNMPGTVKTGLRLAASQLIVADGIASEVVAEAIRRWLTRPGLGVPMLAHIASDVLREGTAPAPKSKARTVAEWAREARAAEQAEQQPDRKALEQ